MHGSLPLPARVALSHEEVDRSVESIHTGNNLETYVAATWIIVRGSGDVWDSLCLTTTWEA